MDKREAAEKIAKLRKLSDDPRTPSTEAASARRTADRLATEHHLGPADLEIGKMCSAYDDLIGEVEKIVKNNPRLPAGLFGSEQVVRDVVGKLRQADDSDKSSRLRKFVTVVRTASMFVGDNKYVSEIKIVMDTVLKNHGVSI